MASLGPVVDATVSKVIAVASEQLHLVWGWKEDLKRFRITMKMLGGVLQDAHEKHSTGHPHLQAWLEELRAVSDEANDMLEEVAYHNLRCQVAVPKSNWKQVSYLLTPSNHHPLVFCLRMANKVKNLNIHLADICHWATLMGLQYKFANTSVPMAIANKHTHSFLASTDPALAIARSKDVNQIVNWLTDESGDQEILSIISVVGMPGLGKTILAKAVCANDIICQHFGKNIMWVHVSLNFDVERILGEMLESLRGTPSTLKNTSTLLKEISGALEKNGKDDKNYLLVLDEVWNEESEKWDELRHCLLSICKNPSNRVLVTTRSEKVASTMGTFSKHMIRLTELEDNECWPIIKGRAFGSTTIPPELEEIGQRIGKKCGGSPLVVDVIGGTLSNKRDKDEWLSVERKMDALSSLQDQHSRIMHALQLSFDQLPKLALKQCFAFCSIFPRAFVMNKNVLVQLWKAEGFLQPSKENSAEDVGSEYFNDLLSHCLFQAEERDYFGNVESCKMHNLIHYLAKSVSKFETRIFNSDESKITISNGVQHLNLFQGVPTNLGDLAPKLCTLFSNHGFPHGMAATKFKRLRVLSFCDAFEITQFPTCFANSKSLRYLDISGTQIKKLPRFVTKLYNLQTFRFTKCKFLKMPKGGIGNLINLRHIYFDDEERMPANLGRLTNLQTLPLFFVDTTKGRKIKELGSLSELTGRLEICNLELVEDKLEAEGATLHEKAVDDLELRWGEKGNHDKDEEVLEGLQPHSNIRRLSIRGYGGRNLAPWTSKNSDGALASMSLRELKQFPSLVKLEIRECRKLRSIPGEILGSLPSLKSLVLGPFSEEMDEFPNLSSISTPASLEQLSLWGWGKLTQLPDIQRLTALEELSINSFHGLESLPQWFKNLSSLQRLDILECPKLKEICGKGSCPEWLNVSHIRIDGETIQSQIRLY